MSNYKLDCWGETDLGFVRDENQDQYLIADLVKAVRIQSTSLSHDDHTEVAGSSHGKVFLVADGMGGHAAGNRASALAVDEMISFMVNRMAWHAFDDKSIAEGDNEALSRDLARALKHCQNKIWNEAALNPKKSGMGTTLTVAILVWPNLSVVHAGDSRCYVFNDGKLKQVTQDHTVAEAYVQAGEMSVEEAEKSKLSHQLWNVLGGGDDDVTAEIYSTELKAGDSLLLCTDGLTKHVSDDLIVQELSSAFPAKAQCANLVRQAKLDGGTDNITVVVARFLDEDSFSQYQSAEAQLSVEEPESGQADTEPLPFVESPGSDLEGKPIRNRYQ